MNILGNRNTNPWHLHFFLTVDAAAAAQVASSTPLHLDQAHLFFNIMAAATTATAGGGGIAPASDKRPDSRRLADFAAKAAETFVSAYYAASDSPQRTNLVPTLYLANSSIVWNGTPVSGQQELTAMLNSMPGSKHEVHAFDCHALGGSVDGGELQYHPNHSTSQ